MEGEEITEQVTETVDREQAPSAESVDSIFSDALKEKGDTPEDAGQTEASEAESQSQTEAEAKEEAEKLFAELVVGEAQKLPFKTEKDLESFIKSNKVLDERGMRLADYTRKTMQVAEEKKQIEKAKQEQEEQSRKELEIWGGEKPDHSSLNALGDIWQAFRHGSPQLVQAINSFVSDIQLIVAGKAPQGPLAGQNGQFSESDSRLLGLKREIDQIKREKTETEKKYETERQRESRERAISMLDSWESGMKEKGIVVERDEFGAMAQFGHLVGTQKADGKTYTFDDAYRAALAFLSRSEKLDTKKQIAKAGEVKKNSPRMPTSKVPANAQPHAETLDAIFQEGIANLKE